MLRFEDCLPRRNELIRVALPVRALASSLRLRRVMALRLTDKGERAFHALSLRALNFAE